jgi:flavin-dependent thymidylate synthase
MKVILAGFNVDLDALKEYKKKNVILTPESISAAYARISRSPEPVDKLREESRKEVAESRRSNRTIIFEMGHHSVAEHAVFNFDIIGISRIAIEELEKFRLCSYTEKSQRYVTLKGDFVIPEELAKSSLIDDYCDMIKIQNDYYKYLFERISVRNLSRFSGKALNKKHAKALQNLAKEDARYILSMATQTQVGATINARNLELMIRRFASNNLKEINELGDKFYALIHKIAPSIILFHKANDYDQKTYPGLRKHMRNFEVMKIRDSKQKRIRDVDLVDHTPDGDTKILAALLFRVTNQSYKQALKRVRKMSKKQKTVFFKKACCNMELYDVALREFEYAHLTYSLVVSAGCFGQLKRHRLASITCQDYEPALGFTIPDSVIDIGEENVFIEIVKKSEAVYKKIEKKYPHLGAYILTNAHRKRVLLRLNSRELYHLSRLREDPTAQWDIRDKAKKMSNLARRVMPITASLLAGKSDYPKIYKALYGKNPKITQVPLL